MDDMLLSVCDNPTEVERTAILEPLGQFNTANGYPGDPRPVAVLLKDDAGTIVGGLWGRTIYDWLFVEFLIVPEGMRGRNIGTDLMAAAEEIAVDRKCVGAWLTTFSFQAQAFYEKLGYASFGRLEQSPGDNSRIFLKKLFASTAG